jgi:hypothetical protein
MGLGILSFAFVSAFLIARLLEQPTVARPAESSICGLSGYLGYVDVIQGIILLIQDATSPLVNVAQAERSSVPPHPSTMRPYSMSILSNRSVSCLYCCAICVYIGASFVPRHCRLQCLTILAVYAHFVLVLLVVYC